MSPTVAPLLGMELINYIKIDNRMKRIEILMNRLNFGVYYPLQCIDNLFQQVLDKMTFAIAKRIKTPQEMIKYKEEKDKANIFVTNFSAFCNYNLIDLFVGFSIAIMFLVITTVPAISDPFDEFLLAINIREPAFLFLGIIGGIISYLPLLYFFLLDDKRKKYFAEFNKEPNREKKKWSAITLIVYIAAWAITIGIRLLLI